MGPLGAGEGAGRERGRQLAAAGAPRLLTASAVTACTQRLRSSNSHRMPIQVCTHLDQNTSAHCPPTHSWLDVLNAFSADCRLEMVPLTAAALTV